MCLSYLQKKLRNLVLRIFIYSLVSNYAHFTINDYCFSFDSCCTVKYKTYLFNFLFDLFANKTGKFKNTKITLFY